MLKFNHIIILIILSFVLTACSNNVVDEIKTGLVVIQSEPQGGSIILNDNFTGKHTPDTLSLDEGSYRLKLQLLGYTTIEDNFECKGDQTIELDYQFEPDTSLKAVIFIDSYPPGAEISINYQPTSKVTPDTIQLSLGASLLGLTLSGYKTFQENLTINTSESDTFRATLQPRKRILIEDFSNINCPACSQPDRFIPKIVQNNPSNTCAVAYHIAFPNPLDPFYQANMTDNNNRKEYYSVSSAPQVFVDGFALSDPTDSLLLVNEIDNRKDMEPPVGIVIVGQPGISSIEYSVDIYGYRDITAIIYSVLVESEIIYDIPPGTNGTSEFHHIMREFKLLTENQNIVQSSHLMHNNQTFTSLNEGDYSIIIFIQNDITKEIYQSGIFHFTIF